MIEGYIQIASGHWYQKEITGAIPNYNFDYCKNSYDVYSTTDQMSILRYNLLRSYIGDFKSICDFGYGNGSFLRYCNAQKLETFGFDISDYPTPEQTKRIFEIDECEVDVLTFFDSIEHLVEQNLVQFLKIKKTKHICISLPWFHESLGSYWFKNWKHRRENEHFHHFDSHGLINLLVSSGFSLKFVGNPEDKIRKPVDNFPNILTAIATKI